MRRIILALLLAGLLAGTVAAQNNGIEKAAGILVDDFIDALRNNDAAVFIESYLLSDSQLKLIVDEQNRSMGYGPDDDDRFTIEQARGFMDRMRGNFHRALDSGIEALSILSGIKPGDLQLKTFRAQKSYWEPPVVEISIVAGAKDSEVVISLSNLSLYEGELRLGPSARVEIQGYFAQDVIGFYIFEALRRQDAELYADKVFTDIRGLKLLLKTDALSGSLPAELSVEDLYKQTRIRIIDDFKEILNAGIQNGVNWSSIENTWSGFSASLQGEIYQVSIPLEFSSAGSSFRIVLEYCSQLASDPSVFFPGEFVWQD